MFDFLRRFRAKSPSKPDPRAVADQLEQARLHAVAGRYSEALALWQPLAHAGIARAQGNIGSCFAMGYGVERDPTLGKSWLGLAAEAGDPLSQRNLATVFYDEDRALSAKWYRTAAENGDAVAANMLGRMLAEGDGVPLDLAAARRWSEFAAAAGIAEAATRLGTMCNDAQGASRDTVAAVRWWCMGARAGDAEAAARLGAAYHLGQGVARDDIEAFAWLAVARDGGSLLARPFLGEVERALSGEMPGLARTRAAALRDEIVVATSEGQSGT